MYDVFTIRFIRDIFPGKSAQIRKVLPEEFFKFFLIKCLLTPQPQIVNFWGKLLKVLATQYLTGLD